MRSGNELMVYTYRDALPEYESIADFTLENDGGVKASLEKLIKIILAETGGAAQ
jgi:hypothetical protein